MAKKNQTTGQCKYCGQSMIIHLPEGWDPEEKGQEELDQLATEQCECVQAMSAEAKQKQKREAVKRMEKFYDKQMLEIKGGTPEANQERNRIMNQSDLMVKVIEEVVDRDIYAASIQISQSQMFSVAKKANGDLQVKRVYKGVEEWLF